MAKNTSTFLNDIKNYDLIRQMLHHIYMYGNYSKGDIVKNNIAGSERSVYDMITRIKNYLGGEYLTTHNLPDRKKDKRGYRFKYDPFQCPINYLADSYKNCSYVIEDFIFYFTLLQAFKPYPKYNAYRIHNLKDYKEDPSELLLGHAYDYDTLMSNFHDVLTANEDILQILGQSSSHPSDSESLITPAKAKDRMNELVELGIINKHDHLYALAPDIFEAFDDEIDSLTLMVQFFYNFSELCVPGYYLAATLSQYETAMGHKNHYGITIEQENPVFFYKNCSIQNVIDDDIFWSILCAINESRPITFKYKNKSGTMTDYYVFPIKLVVEQQYGRHYVYAYNYSYGNFILMRLDSVFSVNPAIEIDKNATYCFLEHPLGNIKEQLNELYATHMKHVWNTTTSDETFDVLVHFSFPEKDYSKMLYRVTTTGRDGIIIPIDESSFDYFVKTKSLIEMKPWIRNFGEHALVDKKTCPELHEQIKQDYRKALSAYGLI